MWSDQFAFEKVTWYYVVLKKSRNSWIFNRINIWIQIITTFLLHECKIIIVRFIIFKIVTNSLEVLWPIRKFVKINVNLSMASFRVASLIMYEWENILSNNSQIFLMFKSSPLFRFMNARLLLLKNSLNSEFQQTVLK